MTMPDMNKTWGRVLVDFVGSIDEAKEYAKQHKMEFPLGLSALAPYDRRATKHAGEYPILSARFTHASEQRRIRDQFIALGWDQDSQFIA